MTQTSADILERFRHARSTDIDLTLRAPYFDLLKKLGDPHKRIPPVIHVAGTNGKGSTCAFLRAMIEAAGYKAHVYTSPHLVSFHERIRIAGKLIEEEELVEILQTCENLAEPQAITYFEAATAAAFTAFARHPADITILEVGLGGRLDATNIVPSPVATVITRLSYDHREYLGDTLAQIAKEKAGIMRPRTPCFTYAQNEEALKALQEVATSLQVPLNIANQHWRVEPLDEKRFRFTGPQRSLTLPRPALIGEHQVSNAGLAIATLDALPLDIPDTAIIRAMQTVEWPARLQRLDRGALADLLPQGSELWLDGGHNDSAGEILAAQAKVWKQQDNLPLQLITGMLTTKVPEEFLSPLAPYVENLRTVKIEDEPLSRTAEDLAACAGNAGIKKAAASSNITQALNELARTANPSRILICGSLYLAGNVLKQNI